MKNIIWLVLAIILLITGCADITSDAERESKQGEDQEKTQESTKNDAETSKNEPEEDANEEEQTQENRMDKDKEKTTEPIYQIDEETSSVVPVNEEGNEKVVLLTIDDAPDGHALKMANTLKRLGLAPL